ncbi:MAG TPA: hypothetical protein VEQ65_10830, partial [Opitutus sp.]|nr:hypothetical protein [Opitutus sp.]
MSLAVLLTPAATRAATADSPGRLVSTVLASTSGAVIDEVRCAVEAPDGTLVVGSNSLAIFDGYKWQTFEVGDAYAFRALAPVPGSASHRVWVGAIGELGYLERDGTGRWHYTSLRRELAASGMSRISDVWAVCPLGDGAAWITSDHVLRWTPHRGGDGHFETWRLPSLSRLALFGGGSEVFVHQEGSGLLKLGAAGPPERLVGNDALPQGPMNWMAASAPTALVGIGNEAYQWDRGATFTRLDALSAMLADSLPTGAAVLADGRVAIGTFRGGLVLAAATGEPLGRYGTDDGLLDASMYSVHGHDGRLWIASPAGLSRIDEPGHAEFFERHRHLHDGRPIKALDHQGETFLLTSSGLFRERRESNRTRLETVLSPGAPLTDAVSIGSALWVSGFGGLWRIAGAPARQEHFTPTDVARVGRSAQLASGVLFIEDYRLKA